MPFLLRMELEKQRPGEATEKNSGSCWMKMEDPDQFVESQCMLSRVVRRFSNQNVLAVPMTALVIDTLIVEQNWVSASILRSGSQTNNFFDVWLGDPCYGFTWLSTSRSVEGIETTKTHFTEKKLTDILLNSHFNLLFKLTNVEILAFFYSL